MEKVKICDWSKLITINFAGGFGGDFFSRILSLAVNNLDVVEDGKLEWLQYRGVSFSFSKDRQCYFRPFRCYAHDLKESAYFKDGRSVNTPYFGFRQKPYLMKMECWDEDRYTFARNIEKRLFEIYSPPPLEYDVVNTHNVSIRSTRVSVQEILPKSKNICLTCSTFEEWLIFRVLYIYKHEMKQYLLGDTENSLIVLEAASRETPVVIPTNLLEYIKSCLVWYGLDSFDKSEFNLNAYDMFFKGVDYSEDLSKYLGIDLKLSEKYIEMWRSEAESILALFGMTYDGIYNIDQVAESIAKYVLENRPSYNVNV